MVELDFPGVPKKLRAFIFRGFRKNNANYSSWTPQPVEPSGNTNPATQHDIPQDPDPQFS
jgi:hypothetical protein